MIQEKLIELIYDGIENRRGRREFLAGLAEVIEADAVWLLHQDRKVRWAISCASWGMDGDTVRSYESHWVKKNPWACYSPYTGQTRLDGEVLTLEELRDSEFYQGFLAPRGWLHTSSLIIGSSPSEYSFICAYRKQGPFGEKERGVYQGLAPHLATAVRLLQRLDELKEKIDRLRNGGRDLEILGKFKLSPIETDIALALLRGETAKEYAARTGRAESTVRHHIKSIFHVLGVRRQVDLIRVLLGRSNQS